MSALLFRRFIGAARVSPSATRRSPSGFESWVRRRQSVRAKPRKRRCPNRARRRMFGNERSRHRSRTKDFCVCCPRLVRRWIGSILRASCPVELRKSVARIGRRPLTQPSRRDRGALTKPASLFSCMLSSMVSGLSSASEFPDGLKRSAETTGRL